MATAEIEKLIPVSIDKFFETITNYETYSEFVDGVNKVQVKKDNGNIEVQYSLSVMGKDFTYVLKHSEDKAQGKVAWELISSDFFKKNSGSWTLKKQSDSSILAKYELDVEFKVPIPGFILNKLVKGSLPSLIKNFEERAKAR